MADVTGVEEDPLGQEPVPSVASDATIVLDPTQAEAAQAREARRLNLVEIPLLRAAGLALLAALVLLHDLFLVDTLSGRDFAVFGGVLTAYTALSWLVLVLFYGRTQRLDLGLVFLSLDLLAVAYSILVTGADRSWLFFMLLVRVADQTHTTAQRVRFFAHAAALVYLLLMASLALLAGHAVFWPAVLTKTVILYSVGLYLALTAYPAELHRNRAARAIRLARDRIRELEEKSRELEAAPARAEAATRPQTDFLANVSHEIKTPLHGILGMTDLALGTALDPEQREYLESVRSSASALLKVVSDILDFSKLEAGQLDFEEVEFSLRTTLEQAVSKVRVRAEGKGLALRLEVAEGAPDRLLGDPQRLAQVLGNLLDNAVKFTARGEVAVGVRAEPQPDGAQLLHVQVRDTGIGIPADKRDAIFEAFTQADGSTTRRYGGTGLGLTIAARLVKLLRGRLSVESEEGQGSTFHFTARYEALPSGETVPPGDPALLRGARVLVIDDDDANRKQLEETLTEWGVEVLAVSPDRQPLSLLERHRRAGAPVDLVLVEPYMGELDGFALARRILEQEAAWGIGVVLMSGSARRGDAARCRELGAVGYLRKPVARDSLLGVLSKALAARAGGEILIEILDGEPAPTSGQAAFDLAEALKRLGGDRELLREVAAAFLEEGPGLMRELADAVAGADATALRTATHSLRGSLGSLTTRGAYETAEHLESLGLSGDWTQVAAVHRQLEDEVRRLGLWLVEVAAGRVVP